MRFTKAELSLITITAIWGLTFLAVETAMRFSTPMVFVGMRFGLAALALSLVSIRVLRGLTWHELRAGIIIGAAIAAGYGLQTAGVADVGASRSAFITALYVPMVPILQWLVLRRLPRLATWAGVTLAFAGLVLVAGPGGASDGVSGGWAQGEWLTLASALAIAVEILLISAFARDVDSRRVTIIQLAAASLFAFAAMPLSGESLPAFHPALAALLVALAIASAAIQLVMNWAQRSVSPARATIIYSGEPVWAALFGRIAGERLPGLALVGGALIVLGVLISELKPKRSR